MKTLNEFELQTLGLSTGSTKVAQLAQARELLRSPNLRQAIFACAKERKKYTTNLLSAATKPVITLAVKMAVNRLVRRAAAVGNQPNNLERRLRDYRREKRRLLTIAHNEDVLAFQEAIAGVFRTATAGTHSTSITIEPMYSFIGADGSSTAGKTYSSSCTYRKTDSHHDYCIPPRWKTAVRDRGLEVLDGMVTLAAVLESNEAEIQIYSAVWVRQGRGFSLEMSRGWIARQNAVNYHSDKSPAAARTGLKRKLSWQAVPVDVKAARLSAVAARRAEHRRKQLERLNERLNRFDLSDVADIEVTYEDSRQAGNCHDGTVAFGERLFGDDRRKATIGEVVERLSARGENAAHFVDSELGRQFVVACLRAIRRQRQTQRLFRQ